MLLVVVVPALISTLVVSNVSYDSSDATDAPASSPHGRDARSCAAATVARPAGTNGARARVPIEEPVEVAPGVFAFTPGNGTDDFVDGNTTVVIGTTGVAVVDAPSVRRAEEHVRWIRGHTQLPVLYLVNTHWHRDHVFGNQVYAREFPGVRIVATTYTKLVADTRNPAIIARFFRGGPAMDSLVARERAIAAGKTGEGKPATEYEVRRARDALAYIALEAPAWGETRYTPPTLTFDDELRLDLGDREVVLRRAPGHTWGDAVAWLPKAGVLVTGDLVIAPVPYGIKAHFHSWSATLRELEGMAGVKAIVPGHGAVQRSWDYERAQHALIDALLEQVEAGARAGLSLDQVRARVDLSRFEQQLAGADPGCRWAFRNYFLDEGIEDAYAEVRGDR